MESKKYSKHKRILLFFSGGLDTSFLLNYFTEEFHAEVITVAFDLGGDALEVSQLEQRARSLGSTKHILLDARKEFIEQYCWRAVKANALFQGMHPLSSSLSRPLMAKSGVALAKKYMCSAIMHGSNGWQNNSARFDTAIRVLSDKLEIIEPIMEQNISREFAYKYLQQKGLQIDKKEDDLFSSDNNIWGREVEDGVLDHLEEAPKEGIYRITISPEKASDQAEYVSIGFVDGAPSLVNGKKLPPLEIVTMLNTIGGKHGIGRHDALEDKNIGYKMREIHESPAATLLIQAHKDLENTVLPRRTLRMKNSIDSEWVDLACYGLWYHPLREQLETFIDEVNKRVSGVITLKLYKGNGSIVRRQSPYGLDKENLEKQDTYMFTQGRHPNRNYYDFYAYEAEIAKRTE
ncbi:MAG: argininosuccinate synthase [Patescibacteria group bacterium]